MSRVIVLLMISVLALVMFNCKGKPKIEPEQPKVVVAEPVDTTPPPPPPPPPPPVLQATQFTTVLFAFDKFNLESAAKIALDKNYELLKDFPDAIIKIEGHCDERGSVEYNLSLGEKRAKSVMNYLTGLGIDAKRLSIITYGKERPVDNGHNEEAWNKNRRAEFRIISQ